MPAQLTHPQLPRTWCPGLCPCQGWQQQGLHGSTQPQPHAAFLWKEPASKALLKPSLRPRFSPAERTASQGCTFPFTPGQRMRLLLAGAGQAELPSPPALSRAGGTRHLPGQEALCQQLVLLGWGSVSRLLSCVGKSHPKPQVHVCSLRSL